MSEINGSVIKTEQLSKKYGKKIGVKCLNFCVEAGEIFGFLGPNGAGKTTTINLLLDLIRPTEGRALVFGMDPRRKGNEIRSRIGFIPGDLGFYENMKGFDYLIFLAGLRGKDCKTRIRELAELFFNVDLGRKIKTYSRGMKQIIGIIQAFMTSPDLYVLDEPTANLDPLMNQRFYHLVEEERRAGKTVFLSSHMLGEVERLCQRVCIIKNGEIVLTDKIENIRKKMKEIIEVSFSSQVDPEKLKVEGVTGVTIDDGRYILEIEGQLNPILARLSDLPIDTFDFRKMTLEEIFWNYFEKDFEQVEKIK
jgi:ABC-2 type transport system ATP-binding protein